jgi:hypothetical protein
VYLDASRSQNWRQGIFVQLNVAELLRINRCESKLSAASWIGVSFRGKCAPSMSSIVSCTRSCIAVLKFGPIFGWWRTALEYKMSPRFLMAS